MSADESHESEEGRRTLLVAPSQVVEAWKAVDSTEPLVVVSDDALDEVTDAILRHRPAVVVDQTVGSTSHGRDFLRRLQWDPSFEGMDIRIIPGRDVTSLLDSPPPAGELISAITARTARVDTLPYRETGRVRLTEDVIIQIDGSDATLVDLSPTGAQVTCPLTLRPQQHVRVTLPEEEGRAKLRATVVWCSYELPKAPKLSTLDLDAALAPREAPPPHYRTGIAFDEENHKAVAQLLERVQEPEGKLTTE